MNLVLLSMALIFSAAKSTVIVEGTVVSYDTKVIVLKQESGALLQVPRALLPKSKGIRVGSEKIRVELSPSDFVRLNEKTINKAIKK